MQLLGGQEKRRYLLENHALPAAQFAFLLLLKAVLPVDADPGAMEAASALAVAQTRGCVALR